MYRAFVIGPDGLATAMHVITADRDSEVARLWERQSNFRTSTG